MASERRKDPVYLVGVKQISEALGIGRYDAIALLRAKEIPAGRIGKAWVTTWTSLEEWALSVVASGAELKGGKKVCQ